MFQTPQQNRSKTLKMRCVCTVGQGWNAPDPTIAAFVLPYGKIRPSQFKKLHGTFAIPYYRTTGFCAFVMQPQHEEIYYISADQSTLFLNGNENLSHSVFDKLL